MIAKGLDAATVEAIFKQRSGESQDDLHLKMNARRQFPVQKAFPIKSQQTICPNVLVVFPPARALCIELMQYDAGSNDDNLGGLMMGFPDQFNAVQRFGKMIVMKDSEDSIHEVTVRVEPCAPSSGN